MNYSEIRKEPVESERVRRARNKAIRSLIEEDKRRASQPWFIRLLREAYYSA